MSENLLAPEEIVGQKWTFFTPAGTFSGTVVDVTPLHEEKNKGYGITMVNVTYRPSGAFLHQMQIPECVVYSRHLVASTDYIEPITVKEGE